MEFNRKQNLNSSPINEDLKEVLNSSEDTSESEVETDGCDEFNIWDNREIDSRGVDLELNPINKTEQYKCKLIKVLTSLQDEVWDVSELA